MAYEIRKNEALHRFELEVEGKVAFTAYAEQEGAIEFRHTEVPPELEGKGIGSALAKHVLDYAKSNHLEAIVTCPFIKKWQMRHPG
ncbi:MAG: N-acetyltransferase [Fibrobacteres bacterium]|nr:N-acetyltransferase [Fibrobacterota bacterium]